MLNLFSSPILARSALLASCVLPGLTGELLAQHAPSDAAARHGSAEITPNPQPGGPTSPGSSTHASRTASAYAPFQFLLGEWHIGPEGGPPQMIARFKFGTNSNYLWNSLHTVAGATEHMHFEGMIVWNGVQKNFDFLFVLDSKQGGIQEQGTLSVAADGTIVRDIVATYAEGEPVLALGGQRAGPDGFTGRFRQTFKVIGPDKVRTQVLRESNGTWIATFPGSDNIVMTKAPAERRH